MKLPPNAEDDECLRRGSQYNRYELVEVPDPEKQKSLLKAMLSISFSILVIEILVDAPRVQ